MRFRLSGRAAHRSLSPSAAPSSAAARRSQQGGAAPAAWWALLAAALAVAGSARADPQTGTKPEASSFAPHHSRSHVYGTPVSKPIVHKRKKRKPPAAAAPAEPIK